MLIGEVPGRWVLEEEVRRLRFLRAPARHRVRLDALSPGVEGPLVRAMAVDPDARFASPGEFAAALGSAPAPPRRDEGDVRALLGRAAELEAAEPTHEGFGISTVKDIARQAEIPSRYLEAAARELERAPERPAPPAPKPPRVLGIPAGLTLNRTVPGEVPETHFPLLMEIIEAELEAQGRVDVLFRTGFVWSSEVVGAAGRQGFSTTRVQVVPRDGFTRITISDDRTGMVGVVVGLGAVVAGAMALPLSGMAWEATALLTTLGLGMGGLGIAAFVRAAWRRRRAQLQRLLDRLEQHINAARR
jgi:hypothetical protein